MTETAVATADPAWAREVYEYLCERAVAAGRERELGPTLAVLATRERGVVFGPIANFDEEARESFVPMVERSLAQFHGDAVVLIYEGYDLDPVAAAAGVGVRTGEVLVAHLWITGKTTMRKWKVARAEHGRDLVLALETDSDQWSPDSRLDVGGLFGLEKIVLPPPVM